MTIFVLRIGGEALFGLIDVYQEAYNHYLYNDQLLGGIWVNKPYNEKCSYVFESDSQVQLSGDNMRSILRVLDQLNGV